MMNVKNHGSFGELNVDIKKKLFIGVKCRGIYLYKKRIALLDLTKNYELCI